MLLWLWRRLAATVPIRSLACEPPYATGAALEKTKKKRKKKRKLDITNDKFNHILIDSYQLLCSCAK